MSNENTAAQGIFDSLHDELLDPGLPDAERSRRITELLKENGIGVSRMMTNTISKAIGRHLQKKAASTDTRRPADVNGSDGYDPFGMGLMPAFEQREPLDLHYVLLHILSLVPVEQQRELVSQLANDLNPVSGVRQGFFRSLLAGYKKARGKAA